jgi:hypothetical protein
MPSIKRTKLVDSSNMMHSWTPSEQTCLLQQLSCRRWLLPKGLSANSSIIILTSRMCSIQVVVLTFTIAPVFRMQAALAPSHAEIKHKFQLLTKHARDAHVSARSMNATAVIVLWLVFPHLFHHGFAYHIFVVLRDFLENELHIQMTDDTFKRVLEWCGFQSLCALTIILFTCVTAAMPYSSFGSLHILV